MVFLIKKEMLHRRKCIHFLVANKFLSKKNYKNFKKYRIYSRFS